MPVRVVYHGHSNVELHLDDHRIQIDPYFDDNPAADVKADAVLPEAILVSHAHFDHCDDAEAIAKRTKATIASNFEIASYYGKKGVKTEALNHGGGVDFPWGRASYTVAFHTSSFKDGTYGGEAGGWVIELGGKTIYFAGDTALFSDMRLIGELWPRIDLACLPIGDRFTMGPKHALLAAEMLRARAVLPIHYNTWDLIKQDGQAFARALEAKGIKGWAVKAGETFEV